MRMAKIMQTRPSKVIQLVPCKSADMAHACKALPHPKCCPQAFHNNQICTLAILLLRVTVRKASNSRVHRKTGLLGDTILHFHPTIPRFSKSLVLEAEVPQSQSKAAKLYNITIGKIVLICIADQGLAAGLCPALLERYMRLHFRHAVCILAPLAFSLSLLFGDTGSSMKLSP